MNALPDFSVKVQEAIARSSAGAPQRHGRLVRMVGMTLEAQGISAPHGALCTVDSLSGTKVEAEVVGFKRNTTLLIPSGDLSGIEPGATVRIKSVRPSVMLGADLLGRVIDANGKLLDTLPALDCPDERYLTSEPLNPLERGFISEVLDVGVKAINGLLTIGRGQRIGLMGGSGVGKSALLGMMTRYTTADIVIIGLIGERAREVNEFIREALGAEGLAKAVVVVAPANVSPVMRLRATNLVHTLAEYFRDQNKNVLMLVDSLTRVAHAQREVGLAIGEPPTAKGYPPSMFALLPNLIERGGVGRNGNGSVTAIYTVLMENDDTSDPVVDIARASLDGQVMLSRTLADAAHYPAIDLAGSISRVMPSIVEPPVLQQANRFRRLWSLYQQNADLIHIGAYQAGTNPDLDEAIAARSQMEGFLRQDVNAGVDYAVTCTSISALMEQ